MSAASVVAAASSGISIAIARPSTTSSLAARLAKTAAIAPAATKQTIAISGAARCVSGAPGDPEAEEDHVAVCIATKTCPSARKLTASTIPVTNVSASSVPVDGGTTYH